MVAAHRSRPNPILIVLIVAVGAFMQMLDASVLAVALPAMARDFGVPAVSIGLGITIYVLAAAIMLPMSSWLADRFGPRRVLLISLCAFSLASVLCGLSRSLDHFVAARFVQGLAGAPLGPVGSIILMNAIDRRDLIKMMNIFSAPMLIAPVIGPPLGGLLTTSLGWPWIFYVNLPIGLAGALLGAVFFIEQPRIQRRFDARGGILNTLACAASIYGLERLANAGLDAPEALPLLLLGLLAGVAAVRHARRADAPLLSLSPLRYRTFLLTTLAAMPFMRLSTVALPFLIPLLLQMGFGLSALQSGLLFLGYTSGDLVMKLLTTRVFRRHGYRHTMQGAIVGTAFSVAVCALFTSGTPYWAMMATLFVGGCFRSFLMTAIGTLSYAEIPAGEMSAATTLNQVVMQMVQAVGVSVVVALLNLSMMLRGADASGMGQADCRLALCAVALLTLGGLLPVHRLERDAGRELSGHG